MIHLPHPKYDNIGAMAVTLAQTLGQNLGMMWNKHRSSAGIWGAPLSLAPTPAPSLWGGPSLCSCLTAQVTASVRTAGWAALWKTLGESHMGQSDSWET